MRQYEAVVVDLCVVVLSEAIPLLPSLPLPPSPPGPPAPPWQQQRAHLISVPPPPPPSSLLLPPSPSPPWPPPPCHSRHQHLAHLISIQLRLRL